MARPHIVHICLDAFRRDHLHRVARGATLCSFLEKFCGQATEFADAISPAPHTCPMHASLFTGHLPHEHGVYLREDVIGQWLRLPDLPGALREEGYLTLSLSDNAFFDPGSAFGRGFDMHTHTPQLTGAVSRSRLHYYTRRLLGLLPARLRSGRDKSGTPAGHCDYEKHIGRHVQLVRGLETSLGMIRSLEPDRPLYMYVNLMPTHGFYCFEAEDAEATRPRGLGGPRLEPRKYLPRMILDFLGVQPMDERTLAELRWAYAAAARYASRLAGRVVDTIDRHLDPANTDLAVFSDHGELLGEHGAWEHGVFLHEELVRVPLIVRSPALPAGRRSEALVQSHWLWCMARERAGLDEPDRDPVGQGSLLDAARGNGVAAGGGPEVAWSLSNSTADVSHMRRAMMIVMRYGLRAESVHPKPLDPHVQAVRTKDAALIVTKSGRRLACRRDADGREAALAGSEAEAVVEALAGHMVEMPEEPAGCDEHAGSSRAPDPELMARLRDLGYAD